MQTIVPHMTWRKKSESPSTMGGRTAFFLAHLNSRSYEATEWQGTLQTIKLPGSMEREAKKSCHNIRMTRNTDSYQTICRKLGEASRRRALTGQKLEGGTLKLPRNYSAARGASQKCQFRVKGIRFSKWHHDALRNTSWTSVACRC